MFTEKKTLSPHKLFLHIGLHKTGTSSIQEALIKNKKLLKSEKIVYLNKLPNLDRMLSTRSFDDTIAKECTNEIIQNLKTYTNIPHKIIISKEQLSGDPHIGYDNTKLVIKYLSEILKGFNTKIIIYLRKQDDFTESLYIQSIKEGKTHSFDNFLKSLKNLPFDWYKYLNRWLHLFSNDQLIIRIYNNQFLEKDIVYDFAKVIKSKVLLKNNEEYNINLGLSRNALEVTRQLNHSLAVEDMQIIRKFLEKIEPRSRFESFNLFSYHERKKYLNRYKVCNEKLVKKFLNKNYEKIFDVKELSRKNYQESKPLTSQYNEAFSALIGYLIKENKYLRYKTKPTFKNLTKMLSFMIKKNKVV